ncbi:uncharacterized protein [Argopecten irradians]|uniref:uncharacterized protein isoform X1 n=2 Tax=Argopecten irradians TaxID=31199 RepID=UPI003710ACCD
MNTYDGRRMFSCAILSSAAGGGFGKSSTEGIEDVEPYRKPPTTSKHTPVHNGSKLTILPLTSKATSEYCDKVLGVISIALATSCVFLAILVSLLFIKVESVKDELGEFTNKTDRKICLPCVQLNSSQLGSLEKAALESLDVALEDDGVKVCCASDSEQTKHLLELVYINSNPSCQKNLHQTGTRCNNSAALTTTFGVSAAHLLAGLQSTNHQSDDVQVQNWHTDGMTSFIEGVNLTTDRLVIEDTGLYMVYSQIYFSKYVPVTALRSATLIYHLVYRFNTIYPNGGNQVLMKTVRTMTFDPRMTHSDLTSFTAAAIQLIAGDQIFVKVSNISLMSMNEKANFLGVVKLQ